MAKAINIVFNLTSLGYSRKDEFLADKLAVKYTRKAGYDPRGAITFFNKLKAEAKKNGPALNLVFLSSHPPVEERIRKVDDEIVSAP
jgi:predicted Zn-dependent protease